MLTQLNLIGEIHALCYITYCALQQIEIYPVDSVIHLSNNQSLINNFQPMQSFDEFVFMVFFCFAVGFFLFCHWFFFWKHNGTDNESS